MSTADGAVHLVRGDDPALTAQATKGLVDRLVGERDPALVVEEHGTAEELDVGAVVDACTTPPFLVDRRLVVVRDAGRLRAADVARLEEVIAAPLPGVHLVLVAGGGALPQALVKAVAAAGGVVEAAAGRGRDRGRWLADRLRAAPVILDARAAGRLEAHLGEELGRLSGILETLAASFGVGATVSEEDLEPFLGAAGSVPPWDLTDAIDAGDVARALTDLRRMLTAGGRHPLAVMASIQSHFTNLLRLDGAEVVSVADAAAVIGTRSEFVAKKALARARDLGGDRIAQAIAYLADADLDLKGRTALP
ncbi:MAG: DNA polymerase III subunit delta, partial [Acidimicrobiales bacterium]